jgi:hypothetical protein
MPVRFCALLVCLSIAACAAIQRTDTAQLPPAFYGALIDDDIGAINEASWALGTPARTRGDPVEVLRAAVAIEYLAGALNTSPRWAEMSPITKMEMLQARAEFRRVLGIRPDATSQAVVNAETWVLWDLARGDADGARKALSAPLFTLPPTQTMQVLSNLPDVPIAHAATAKAQLEEMSEG